MSEAQQPTEAPQPTQSAEAKAPEETLVIRCLTDVERAELDGKEVPAHLRRIVTVEHELVRFAMANWPAAQATGLTAGELWASDYQAIFTAVEFLQKTVPGKPETDAKSLLVQLQKNSPRFRTLDGAHLVRRLDSEKPCTVETVMRLFVPEIRARDELKAWWRSAASLGARAQTAVDPQAVHQQLLLQAQATAARITAKTKAESADREAVNWRAVQTAGGLVSTGFAEIDVPTGGGLGRGDMMVVGGGTNHGKSYFAWKMLRNQADMGRTCLYMSIEDGKDLMLCRMLADYSQPKISPKDIRTAMYGGRSSVDPMAIDAAARTMQAHQQGRVKMIQAKKWKLSDICAEIRSERILHGIDLVVVDYLQAIQPDEEKSNRTQEVAHCVNELKRTCGEVGVALVLLSQYARDDYRDGAEPGINACKYAGDIENEAEVMMLLWRDQDQNLMGKIAKLKWASSVGRRYMISTHDVTGCLLDWTKVEMTQDDDQAGKSKWKTKRRNP